MIIPLGYDNVFSFSAAVKEITNITLYSTHPSIASPMLRTVRFFSFAHEFMCSVIAIEYNFTVTVYTKIISFVEVFKLSQISQKWS